MWVFIDSDISKIRKIREEATLFTPGVITDKHPENIPEHPCNKQ